jgi:hypothetical protein
VFWRNVPRFIWHSITSRPVSSPIVRAVSSRQTIVAFGVGHLELEALRLAEVDQRLDRGFGGRSHLLDFAGLVVGGVGLQQSSAAHGGAIAGRIERGAGFFEQGGETMNRPDSHTPARSSSEYCLNELLVGALGAQDLQNH